MSCKVLRSEVPLSAVPFFGENKPKSSGPPQKWEPSGSPEGTSSAEIQMLRSQLKAAERTLTEKVREARDAGYREGEAAGMLRAEEAGRPVFEKLTSAIADLGSLRKRLRHETEKDLVKLAIAIARRVLHREISLDAMAIQGLVRAALDKVQTREITEIRIYPGHEDAVRRCLAAHHSTGIEVICDPALQPGDIAIATRRGDLQASIDTQLAEIERGLTDRIER